MIGTPAARIAARAAVFEPISSIAAGGGPIQVEAGLLDEAGERGVLGEEAVAGMDRPRAGAQRGLDEHVPAEVALGCRTRADEVRLVGGANVRAPPVGLRVDGDTAEAELAQRAKDADRDLAAVRDEHLRERCHGIGGHDARILPHE